MVDIRSLVNEVGKLHERAISLGVVKSDTAESEDVANIHKEWSLALINDSETGAFIDDLARGAIRLLDLTYVFDAVDIVRKEFEIVITSDVYNRFAVYTVPALVDALHMQTCAMFDTDYMRFKSDLSNVAHTIGDTLGLLYKWMEDAAVDHDYEDAVDFETAVSRGIKNITDMLDDVDVSWWANEEGDTHEYT